MTEITSHDTTNAQSNASATVASKARNEIELNFHNPEEGSVNAAKNPKVATPPDDSGDKTSTVSHTVPMSPSQEYNRRNNMGQQGYYYSQSSPATPLRQHNGFMRQAYPSIPPLSPTAGGGNRMIFDESSLVGGIPPASPLFPMSRIHNSPGVQYLTAQQLPNSPLLSYAGMMIQGSPEHTSWIDNR